MYYFAYGSNMSKARLRERVPSAQPLGCYRLEGFDLRFHKVGVDNSAKCDAFCTDHASDNIYGVLYEIDPAELPSLNRAEGLGFGYDQTIVFLSSQSGDAVTAMTYVATHIREGLKPYDWYLNHLLVGAKEGGLPEQYVSEKIAAVKTKKDKDKIRSMMEQQVYFDDWHELGEP